GTSYVAQMEARANAESRDLKEAFHQDSRDLRAEGMTQQGALAKSGAMSDTARSGSMIAAEDAEAFRIIPGRADLGVIILCDHAENTLPPEYGTLGLPEAQLQRHIAYDIGAAAITEMLAASL